MKSGSGGRPPGRDSFSVGVARLVTRGAISRVLLGGFALVILLLLTAGMLGVRNIKLIRTAAADLTLEQDRISELLEEVRKEQRAISAVYASFARQPENLDRALILQQLEASDRDLERIVDAAADEPEQDLWKQLQEAASRFSVEARRLLDGDLKRPLPSKALLDDQQRVLALVDQLAGVQSGRSLLLKSRLDGLTGQLFRESAILLGAGLLLATFFAFLTVRLTNTLVRQMEWQTGELSRVSWHLLENQETTARRFSHELHDELGQSLTALKANLVSLTDRMNGGRERVDDSIQLVDEAIGNVRELSQLLRPVILDDFGLSAGLKWQCDRFTQRTGIEVAFTSELEGRLADETETHLFRIAQEALTNIARHSKATQVSVRLWQSGDQLRLSIRDNGQGVAHSSRLDPGMKPGENQGMGLVGMRARARSAGGKVTVHTAPGQGLEVSASVPFRRRVE